MRKKIFVLLTVLIMSILVLSGCTNNTEQNNKKNSLEMFYINEWGVFIKSYDCADSNVLNTPSELTLVRKPVIYFHSITNETRIDIEINNIRNTTLIPTKDSENITNLEIFDDKILWNVTIENDKIKTFDYKEGENVFYKYLDYLFYEGDTSFNTEILAGITKNKNNIEYYVKNSESYEISNVFLIFGNTFLTNTNDDDFIECVYFGDLKSGEQKTIFNENDENIYSTKNTIDKIKDTLISSSLTEDEAEDLLNYWQDWWFNPSFDENYTLYSRLIYIIPENIYNNLLPISFSPEPENMNRVGIFTITDLGYDTNYSNDVIYSTITGTGIFSFYYNVETIDVSELEIHIINPNGMKDEIKNLESGSKIELTDGFFRWIDKVENGLFGDGNDHIDVYNNDGLIAGEWNVQVIQKLTGEVLYNNSVTIDITFDGPGVYIG